MPAPAKETADYHALRGDVALIRHDLVGYEKELLEAKRRDPQEKKYNLGLATLHVAANDFATREAGVRELLDLSDDKSFHRDAMHRLADDALRRNQITRALEYARDLDSLSNRDFSDRLLLLSILKAANEAETQSLLEQLKKDASDDAVKIGALIGWMNSQNVRRSGGVDENTATDIVGKTNDSAQSGGGLHGDQRLGGITQILRGNEVGCFRIYAKCTGRAGAA
jgi:hypothetical protein